MRFHPIIVGVVNAIVPGLGYVLIDERKVFGWLLLAGSISCIILSFIEPGFMSRSFFISTTHAGLFFESIWYVLFIIAYGYDAYSLANGKRVAVQVVIPAEEVAS